MLFTISPIPEHGFPPDFIKSTQDKTAAAASGGGSQVITIEDIEEDAREVPEDLASATASKSQIDTLTPPSPSETSTPGPSQHGAQQQQSNRKMSSARKKRGKRKGHNRTGSKSSVKDIFAGGSTGQNIFAMDEDEETNQVGSLPLFYFFQCLKCLELFSSLLFTWERVHMK